MSAFRKGWIESDAGVLNRYGYFGQQTPPFTSTLLAVPVTYGNASLALQSTRLSVAITYGTSNLAAMAVAALGVPVSYGSNAVFSLPPGGSGGGGPVVSFIT